MPFVYDQYAAPTNPSLPPLPRPSKEKEIFYRLISALFDNICMSLTANEPVAFNKLDIQSLSVLARVNKTFFHQVTRTWRSRLCGLVNTLAPQEQEALAHKKRFIKKIHKAPAVIVKRAWFQIQQFNLSLDSIGKTSELVLQATQYNCNELLKLLLSSGANSNVHCDLKRTRTPMITYAAIRGQTDILNTFLEADTHLEACNASEQTPLFVAIRTLANPDKTTKYVPLHYREFVCTRFDKSPKRPFNKRRCIRMLLDARANVHVKTRENETPLMNAAWGGQTETMSLLIRKNVNLNACDKRGETALFYAAHQEQQSAIQILLEARADATLSNQHGDTALSEAACQQDEKIVQMLLDAKGEVNTTNREGNTPLLFAAYFGNLKCISVLLHARANINHCNHAGQPSFMLAAFQGHRKAALLLFQAAVNSPHNALTSASEPAFMQLLDSIETSLRNPGPLLPHITAGQAPSDEEILYCGE